MEARNIKMERDDKEKSYYLEKQEVELDSDEEFQYKEIPVDEDFLPSDLDEDLDTAVRNIRGIITDAAAGETRDQKAGVTVYQPEAVDDFVRNFLVKMKLKKTFDCFQIEWYEKIQKGELDNEDAGLVPDVYRQNEQLDELVKHFRSEAEKYKEACRKAKDTYIKLRKERDFHRMHHRRVIQERNKLLADLKTIKNHYSSYEPKLEMLKTKYESAMNQKTLMMIERDRAIGQVSGLQTTLKNMESIRGNVDFSRTLQTAPLHECGKGDTAIIDEHGKGHTQQTLDKERQKYSEDVLLQRKGHPLDSEFPADSRMNPQLSQIKGPCAHLTRTGGFRLSSTNNAHSHPVSFIAQHPRKQIIATASDDNTWKMWSVPGAELIMAGEGHDDWLSSVDFHPSGSKLASGSGDATVKIWEFSKSRCIHTFAEHQLAVWGVSWHTSGDFLASCSMDNSIKIWDLNSLRCRWTLRGHADSVNAIQFLPYSTTICSASADKTISLWDARTAVCAQTFYGHMHSVNSVVFNLRGDTLASCDSFGTVKLWDVRTVAPMTSFDVGPHAANMVAFDPACSVLAIASNDSTIKMYDIANGKINDLTGHEDGVQCLLFDKNGEYLVSGGSDCSVRIWS